MTSTDRTTPRLGPAVPRYGFVVLLLAPLLLPACYSRVVRDRQGNYVGTVYEGNLPDDSRGFWTDAFETETVVPRAESAEVLRIQRQNQAIYDRQTKGLDLGSGNP